MKLRIGVMGCGTAAHFHAAACRSSEKIKFVSAFDTNIEKAKKLADIYSLTVSRDYHDILRSDEIDAVLITLPHYLHTEFTVAAAEAGKHILCEKPMAPTLEECDTMMRAVKKAVAVALMGYLSAKTGKIVTRSDFERVASTQGTRSIITGLEKATV
ncbi:MAG: Gfo/Idh/MocA family protein [Candidatus Freyarchaeota archaeon]